MCNQPKVIGKIDIIEPKRGPAVYSYTCDECQGDIDSSCGDPRIKVTRTDHDEDFGVISRTERWLCQWCINEQFGDLEPKSMFE
jgi:hypothetical protein